MQRLNEKKKKGNLKIFITFLFTGIYLDLSKNNNNKKMGMYLRLKYE